MHSSEPLKERLIREVAYHNAAKCGFPPGHDEEVRFWLAAEREVDDFLKGSNKPQQVYQRLMSEFYDTLPDLNHTPSLKKASATNPKIRHLHLGREYIKFIHHGDSPIRALCSLENRRDWGHSDVSLSVHPAEIDDLIKRSVLMADTALIADSRLEYSSNVFLRGRQADDTDSIFNDEIIQSNVDPLVAGRNLELCKSVLTEGKIFLLPKTRLVTSRSTSGFESEDHPSVISESGIYDAAIKNGKARMLWSGGDLRSKFIKFLAEIPLPVVPGVGLDTFMTVYQNDLEAGSMLKNLLKEHFFELDEAEGSEQFEAKLVRIGQMIEKDAKLAMKDLEFASKSHLVASAKFLVKPATAVLVGFNFEMVRNNLYEILTGAGMGSAYSLFERRLKHRHEMAKDRYYFMWLLKRG